MAFELFGIVKGQPIQSLALCSKLETAEYHKENTFGDFAGRVIIQESDKTQDEATQEIFDICAPIFQVDATMSATDWETLKCDIKQTTAIELFDAGTLHNVEQLNKVELQPVERKKLKASMLVLETEGQPFSSLFTQMQEEILTFLTKGSTATRKRAPLDDTAKIVSDEATGEEPTIETEPVVEPVVEPTIETEPVVEPVVEPTIETEPVVEPVVEPTIETEPVVEPVVEPTIETEPVVEPAVEPTIETEPVVEPVVEPTIETEPVVEPVVEPTIETEPVVEPVVEPTIETEPVVEPVVEPTIETETVVEPTDAEVAALLEDLQLDSLNVSSNEGIGQEVENTATDGGLVELAIEPLATGASIVNAAIPEELLTTNEEFDVNSFDAMLNDI